MLCKSPAMSHACRNDAFERLESIMLSWALTFLIVAIIAGVLGFGGIAGTAAWIAKLLFVVFIILFLLSLIMGGVRRPSI
jgi:uncharacterized membrane protein YtjA (UPF0391 family)